MERVGLYIHRKFHPRPIHATVPPTLELVAAELCVGCARLILCSVYRPPDRDLDSFLNDLDDFLSQLGDDVSHLCILGDVNIDALVVQRHRPISDFCDVRQLKQIVNTATHIRPETRARAGSATAIDHLYVPAEKNVLWGTGAPVENYHQLIWAHYPFQAQANPKQKRKVRIFSKADWTLFRQVLRNSNLTDLILFAWTIDDGLSLLNDAINSVIHQSVPERLVPNRDDDPWMTKAILKLKRRRNAAYSKFKQSKSPIR